MWFHWDACRSFQCRTVLQIPCFPQWSACPPGQIGVTQEEKGNARLSASFNSEENTLSGVGVLPSGKTLWWNAKRTGEIKGDDKEERIKSMNEDDVPDLKFSSYPAGAYGEQDAAY